MSYYYNNYHVSENYSDRFQLIVSTMNSMWDTLILLDDDPTIKAAYDKLADAFLEMTKDIPEKNGIKKVSKDIKYYANGLIENNGPAVIGKPFAYHMEAKEITPKYKLFEINQYGLRSDRYKQRIHASSGLMKAYLQYKFTGKNTGIKIPKIAILCDDITKLTNMSFDIASEMDASGKYKIHVKYFDMYEKIIEEYMKIVLFYTNGLHKNIDDWIDNYGFDGDDNDGYYKYADRYDMLYQSKNTCILPLACTLQDEFVDAFKQYLDKCNYNVFSNGIPKRLQTSYIPYLTEESVQKYIDIYNQTYADTLKTAIENYNDTGHHYWGAILDELRADAEHDAQLAANKIYATNVHYANSETWANDPTYQQYGYLKLIARLDESADNLDTPSLIETVAISQTNRAKKYNPSYGYLQDVMGCVLKSFYGKTERIQVPQNVDEIYTSKHDKDVNHAIEVTKLSLNNMMENLTELMSILNNIDNEDMIAWLRKRKAINTPSEE